MDIGQFVAYAVSLLSIGLSIFSFVASPLTASRKGYAPYYWVFACGPIGLIVISRLRPLRSAESPEEYEQMETRANLIGSILTGITFFCSMGYIPHLVRWLA